jgi:hypothetical protein
MEELHKTQEHPIERQREGGERRVAKHPFEGEDRRHENQGAEQTKVSEQDGTRRG